MHFDLLPYEILLLIISYMGLGDTFRFGMVNEKTYKVLLSTDFYKKTSKLKNTFVRYNLKYINNYDRKIEIIKLIEYMKERICEYLPNITKAFGATSKVDSSKKRNFNNITKQERMSINDYVKLLLYLWYQHPIPTIGIVSKKDYDMFNETKPIFYYTYILPCLYPITYAEISPITEILSKCGGVLVIKDNKLNNFVCDPIREEEYIDSLILLDYRYKDDNNLYASKKYYFMDYCIGIKYPNGEPKESAIERIATLNKNFEERKIDMSKSFIEKYNNDFKEFFPAIYDFLLIIEKDDVEKKDTSFFIKESFEDDNSDNDDSDSGQVSSSDDVIAYHLDEYIEYEIDFFKRNRSLY